MATIPSELPEWASGGSADITDPTLTKKQTGWTTNEAPPHDFFNWWMNLVFLWVSYLSDFVANIFSTSHAWSALQTFNANVVTNADLLVQGTVELPSPIWHYVGGSGEPAFSTNMSNSTGKPKLRFGQKADGEWVIEGTFARSTGAANGVFVLPTGARPNGTVTGVVTNAADVPSYLEIRADGTVIMQGVGSGTDTFIIASARFYTNMVLA